jgi:epoxide hydrolase-like predicted phosphatase
MIDMEASPTQFRGLVLDWGGVLTMPLDRAMSQWAHRDGVDLRHFTSVIASLSSDVASSPVHRLERGETGTDDFERDLAKALAESGSPVRAEGLLDRILYDLADLHDSMVGLVARARRKGIRTALLSNSWGEHYPEHLWVGLFDVVVISGRVGMRKPERRIYLHTAERLGLAPSACVMVDDLPANIHGAAAAGMVGVLHRDVDRTREELEALFGQSLV